MLIYRCDNCGDEQTGPLRADGVVLLPNDWMKLKLKDVSDQFKAVPVHFCSMLCVQKFDEAAFRQRFKNPTDSRRVAAIREVPPFSPNSRAAA
jgi:hypothetical protein